MLSLYIHVPFCVRKCHYCGFYSTPYSSAISDRFLSALQSEAAAYHPSFSGSGRVFSSLYIGGGTPTMLSLDQLETVFSIVRRFFVFSAEAEYTIEANPNSVTPRHLDLFLAKGINRLSLGIQSLSEDLLAFLGRSHTVQQGIDAFTMARTAGFGNLSLDLIYGIPGQTGEQWLETLNTACDLDPEHVSVYSLSLDEKSRFRQEADAGLFSLPDDDEVARMYHTAADHLEQAGFEHYEISNFSKPGFSCRHNLNYWEYGQYLGLGPAAWSFIGNRRYHTVTDVEEYSTLLLAGESAHTEADIIDRAKASTEMVMLAARTRQGLELERYERSFGTDAAAHIVRNSVPLQAAGLMEQNEGRLRLTRRGFLIANEALSRLIL